MVALLYLLNVGCSSGQLALSKLYANRGGQAAAFNLHKAAAALVVFLLFGLFQGMTWNAPTVWYGIGYGVFLSLSMHAGFVALSIGPMAFTSIIASFSLIIPFVCGVTVWQEPLTVYSVIGMLLLLSSIVLLNVKKDKQISFKWLFYALITMVANGACSLVQKFHQVAYPTLYRTEFMLAAMATVLLFLVAMGLVKRNVAPSGKPTFSVLGALSGVLNGGANYIVLYLAATEKSSVLFPVVSVANVVAVWLVGRLAFRERFRPLQIVGLLLGIAAIVLLNIQR